MKKITLLIILLVALGSAFVSYWVYSRYFLKDVSAPLTYIVKRGNIQDELRVRGEVAAEREYDMAFNSFGNVQEVAVEEGQTVKKGAFLMRLDTTTATLELSRLLAERTQAKAMLTNALAQKAEARAAVDAALARLAALKRGTLPETIEVQTAQTAAARLAVSGANEVLFDAANVAYTAADDAIRTTADQMFDNPRTDHPILAFLIVDDGLRNTLEIQRVAIEAMLDSWQSSLLTQTTSTAIASTSEVNLETVSVFLNDLALALNGAISTGSVTSLTISGWQTDVSLARSAVNTATKNVTNANTSQQAAAASLAVAEQQLSALKTGTASEEIAVQEAVVRQAEAQMASADAGISQAQSAISVIDANIGIANKKIKDSSLFAPADAVITKVWVKQNEQYQQSLEGMPAISLATAGVKIQSEISELDIPKIHAGNGNRVSIIFDAFPNKTYTGEIVSIDPKEVVRDADTYYIVNMTIAESTEELRRRMSADVLIRIAEKENALYAPLFMVSNRDGLQFVLIKHGKELTEIEVQTGIVNDEFVEIISGVQEGDELVASAT
ncbi:MAG: biotin/lipoyl-binding protein [Patescibacteria group bacterium]|jgi:HlyD family secretion protein